MIGRVISHYRLLKKLGEGGMGVVYLAEDLSLERRVALKFLSPRIAADPEARARLELEARAAAALFHPNIGPVHEIGESEGQVFIALAYVEGETLAARLERGRLPLAEALRIARQIAGALAAAHAGGVVHRDVKPANIMLAKDGRAILMDFGLAKASHESGLTRTGATMGTPAYMSPEQAQGKQLDARSDLWSLGVVLDEMLAGRIPPNMVPLVERLLARDPAGRYPRAEDFLADLDDVEQVPLLLSPPVAGSRRPGTRTLLAAVAVLGLLAVAVWIGRGLVARGGAGHTAGVRGLAVMPLENLSGDPGQDYLADGMTDELINELSRIGSLKVIARSSVMRYKGTGKPLNEIARALGVENVIEGAVLRTPAKFRINAQLVEARSSRNLWAQQYEGQFSDALSMQDEVARAIVREVRVKLTPSEAARLARSTQVDPRAHDAYLLGRYEWNRLTRESELKSIEHYRRALSIDPGYALAWVGLADSYYTLSNFFLPPDSAMPMVRLAATRAAALDSTLGDAHTLLGVTYAQYDWVWGLAEREYRKALELNPNSDVTHRYYGYFLIEMGRWDEARRECRLAIERDPVSITNRWLGLWPDYYQARYDVAIAGLEALLREDSTYAPAWSLLGESLEMKGRYEPALAALRRGEKLGGNSWVTAAEARVLARMGRTSEARQILRVLERSATEDAYVSPYALASAYAALGDRDRAFVLLERGVQERCEDLPLLRVDPRMESLHGDPRFERLVLRLGLAQEARAAS